MNTQEKTYVTASELAETLDISMGKSYKIIRQLNSELDRKSTRLNSSHSRKSRMPSSA